MAYHLTLAQAKKHLRIVDDNENTDIQLKIEQASAIVMDYLKARPIAIASSTVADPTVITTTVPHGLVNGTTYTLTGTTTTPTVDGARVVTVTGPTTFTVPVAVTVGQTAAAGTVGAPQWTYDTVPFHVQAATLLVLTHLYANRGDDMSPDSHLWEAVARLLARSRDPALA